MREIKFRAWDKAKKRWLNDYEFTGITPDGKPFMTTNLEENEIWENTDVVQCTGLKDKNGVEIYEGDILRCVNKWDDETIAQVRWEGENDYPAFDLHPSINDEVNSLAELYYGEWDYKVIGNIYENPELLGSRS